MATAAEEAKGEAQQQRGDGGGTTTQEKHDAAAALVGAPAQPAALSVRLWRRTVVPCIRPLLRLAMRSTVSTAHSMLLMRSYFEWYGLPHAAQDGVAPLFLEHLLPTEAAYLKAKSFYGVVRGHLMIAPIVGVPGIGRFVDLRTAWLDDALAGALRAGAKRVVVIAAGFDTRAYRFRGAAGGGGGSAAAATDATSSSAASSGVEFYEIDLPGPSAAKRALVDATLPDAERYPRPRYAAADLGTTPLADALAAAGFDVAGAAAGPPTCFIAEGLIYYLEPEAVARLFGGVAALAAPGSVLAFDYLRADCLLGRALNGGFETLSAAVANRGEPFHSAIEDAPDARAALSALAARYGFVCRQATTPKEAADAYYGAAVRWHEFPATATTCFRFASWERVAGNGGGGNGVGGGVRPAAAGLVGAAPPAGAV